MKTKQFLIVALSLLTLASCTRINPGTTGIKVSYSGDYRGVDSLPQEVGYVWYTPGFSTVIEFPTNMQHVVYSESGAEGHDTNQAIIVGLKGGSSFKMDVAINYTIKPSKAAHIYLKWKITDLEDLNNGYLYTTTRKVLNDIAGSWSMDSILNYRPLYEKTATEILTAKLYGDGIIVDPTNGLTLLKTPIATDKNLEQAILGKITARQEAERKQMELQSSVADANKKMAEARGDSARTVINANAIAEANKKMEQSLTPGILQKMWIEKWKGEVPTYQMGGNTGMMMQMPVSGKK